MASAPTIDIDALLAPISDVNPVGDKIREDSSPTSVYLQLKDARAAARAHERRVEGADEQGIVSPEWQTIFELAPQVLANQSKDLEISVWLIEALLRLEGFAGLRDGFQVARGLVEQYWDGLYSMEDEEGDITKVAPLTGLNGLGGEGTLIQPMRMSTLTVAVAEDGPYSDYHYDQAVKLSQITDPEVRDRQAAGGATTLERFNSAVNATGAPYYIELMEDLEGAIAQFEGLSAAVYQTAGRDAPPSSNIRDLLNKILDDVRSFSREIVERQRASESSGADAVEAPSEGGAVAVAASGAPGQIRNREDALRSITQVAEYFRRTEPQSPISDSLDAVVRRARLGFSELLQELLGEDASWRTALNNAGIRPKESDE